MEFLKRMIAKLLRSVADDIDSNKYSCSEDEMLSILDDLAAFNTNRPLSKYQACDYMGMSRSTFDQYISDGLIPKGEKVPGFKELSWRASELEKAIKKIKKSR